MHGRLPHGALTDKPLTLPLLADADHKQVDSLCPYCGVGCSITYTVDTKANTIVQVSGRASPVNHGRLCVKGRYGFDYVHHGERLLVPLIRKPEYYPKLPEPHADPRQAFREATWDEALDLAAQRFTAIREVHGSRALAGFGSAKCSNEDNYLFQKLIRAVFGTNNVDHCTRLCHASSVAALLDQIGGGSVSNPFSDALDTDAIFIIGSNTTHNHPVAATFIKQAANAGTTLLVADPRRRDRRPRRPLRALQPRHRRGVPQRPDARHHPRGAVRRRVHRRTHRGLRPPARHGDRLHAAPGVAPDRGAGAESDRRGAAYGSARRAMIFWGMGISQHITGTDNARCLINLALLTGNIGRPGTGLHPLRGQNNVQGASDVGLIPMVYTG